MSESKQDQSGASGSSVKEKADETVQKAKATAKAATPKKRSSNGRKTRKSPGARKSPAKKPDQIIKHDPSEHGGDSTASRPDLEPQPVDKALKEVREIREENEKRAATHNRVIVEREVEGVKGTLHVSTADGRVYIEAKGGVVLDHDGAINARHALEAAFQAVS